MIALDVVRIVRVEEADLIESSVAKRGITVALGEGDVTDSHHQKKRKQKSGETGVMTRHERDFMRR